MEVNGEKTVNIDGKDCWTIRQFSNLTGFSESRIRYLTYYGNSQRKLESISFGANKPMIVASELFDFPFTVPGRPVNGVGTIAIKFFLTAEGGLSFKEVVLAEE